MTTQSPVMKRLKVAAAKAAARAAAAKIQLRAAKAQLKQARKLFKLEKRAAKLARRKVDTAAAAAAARVPRPAEALKLKRAIRNPPTVKSVRTVGERQTKVEKAAPKKPKARIATKPRAPSAPETMRSAAEVAKSVIDRLHAPPPILPPSPIIPTDATVIPGDSAAAAAKS